MVLRTVSRRWTQWIGSDEEGCAPGWPCWLSRAQGHLASAAVPCRRAGAVPQRDAGERAPGCCCPWRWCKWRPAGLAAMRGQAQGSKRFAAAHCVLRHPGAGRPGGRRPLPVHQPADHAAASASRAGHPDPSHGAAHGRRLAELRCLSPAFVAVLARGAGAGHPPCHRGGAAGLRWRCSWPCRRVC